jgi:hypothetical protein
VILVGKEDDASDERPAPEHRQLLMDELLAQVVGGLGVRRLLGESA